MTQPYYMPTPLAPKKNPVAWMLWITLWALAAGLILSGMFSYGLADVSIIPSKAQSILSLIASALVMIGVEGNTIPTGVLAFEKWGDEKMHWLNKAAIIASFVGSCLVAIIYLSQRQTLYADSGWRRFALRTGPLFAAIAIIVDYTGGIASLGRLRRDYDVNMREWLKAEAQWNESHGIRPQVDRSDWRVAVLDDARVLASQLNGEGEQVTTHNLQRWLDRLEVIVPAQSESTARRWVDVIKNGDE